MRIDSGVLPQALTFSACLSFQTLKEAFAAKVPVWQSEIKDIKKLYGDKVLGTCTVEQVLILFSFPVTFRVCMPPCMLSCVHAYIVKYIYEDSCGVIHTLMQTR